MTSTTPPPFDDGPPVDEDALRALVRRGRPELATTDREVLEQIWRRIDSEIHGHLGDVGDVPLGDLPEPPNEFAGTVAGDSAPTPIGEARSRRGWLRHVPIAAAAAVALVVGVGIGSTMIAPSDEAVPATLATYELEPLGDVEVAAAAAALVTTGEDRSVELDLDGLPAPDGFHEVWLLDPDTGALTSLGPVRPDGRYVVPSGTDLAALTALDVSVEPLDGDPGHSGVSLLRGEVRWIG